MEYGKIENGNVRKYQSILQEDGGVIYSPTPEQWLENGYLEIIDNRPAEIEGYYQTSIFEIVDNKIVYTYSYILNPVQDDNV